MVQPAGAVVVHLHAAAPGLPLHGFVPPGQVPFALVITTQFRSSRPQVT
jgi:hypothetical protein